MQRHWLPGGNTARGFHSFYHSILPAEEAEKIVLLKGGPGVGKSTFMRRIADILEIHGQQVEYLHCSSDAESLDGVVCREIGFAILDGTAPHIVDPEIPGAADSILNLGAFLDEPALRSRKKEILAIHMVHITQSICPLIQFTSAFWVCPSGTDTVPDGDALFSL